MVRTFPYAFAEKPVLSLTIDRDSTGTPSFYDYIQIDTLTTSSFIANTRDATGALQNHGYSYIAMGRAAI